MVRPEVTRGKSKIRCILDTMSSGRTFDSGLVLPFLFLYLAFSSIISDRRGHFEEQYFLSKGTNVNVCDILKVGPSSIDFCPSEQVCHVITVVRGKGYFAIRLSYHSHSMSSFHQIRLSISGDINLNPGPDRCYHCSKMVSRNHRALNCNERNTFILGVVE